MKIQIHNSTIFFEIDDEFFDKLIHHGNVFYLDKDGYVCVDSPHFVRKSYGVVRRTTPIKISRIIMNCIDSGKDILVDHKDGNKLNNFKSNLRFANYSENCCNRLKTKRKCLSKFKCVCLHKHSGKFQVSVRKNGKVYYGGQFEDEILAAIKADDMMLELHGEFACLNFPLYGA